VACGWPGYFFAVHTVYVVSNTHWDREWYHAAERFRVRLVPLVDELLDQPVAGEGPAGPGDGEARAGARLSFLLDGQAVVLEDYLEVRPERASELSAALRDGRLEAGPWFVLPDELIPGAEGLVRNLLAGARTLSRLRAQTPGVLYCPDSFGHPAALPELARGFDKAVVVVWRGLGDRGADTFWWSAPGGERVLLYHLTRSGYELGANLPAGTQEATDRWNHVQGELGSRPVTGIALLLNGADHHALQSRLPASLEALASAAAPVEVRHASLGEFGRSLAGAAAGASLPDITGELRDSYGYTWTLQGTLGTRAAQKRAYALAERELVRDVEPWAALAALQANRSLRHLVQAAWRPVLLCQPHDTLCGCAIDAVARAMDQRLESAAAQAVELRDQAMQMLLAHDPDAARLAAAQWQPVLEVRNRAARRRSGPALVRLTLKVADVPVGPGSSHVQVSRPRAAALQPVHWPVEEPVQVLGIGMAHERVEAPRSYPDNDAVAHFDAVAWIDDVPAYGVRSLAFGDRVPGSSSPPQRQLVRVAGRSVSNGILTVRWDGAGRLTLEHADGRTIGSLLAWESRRDVGDLYTPAVRQRKLVPRFRGTRVLHGGPLRAVVEQHWRLIKRLEHVDLRVQLVLDAASPFLRIHVFGENGARDHRLRLVVRSDHHDGVTVADAAFGPVERHGREPGPPSGVMEQVVPTAPLHRYVSRLSADRGTTLYSDGLAEYEWLRNGFAVTLLRAVGELSRSNLPERPGHAGWPVPTPEAQCAGSFEARFALLLHGPWSPETVDLIERTADDVLLPMVGETRRWAMHVPPPVHGIALEGEGLAFSCAKESEDGQWMVLRCVNLLDRETAGSWQIGGMIRDARVARLDETPLTPLEATGDRVRFLVPPRGTLTILVR
jgi:alpha-mannosidase